MTDLRCGARGTDELQGYHQYCFPLKKQSNFPRSLSNGKAKATHTAAILLDHGTALLRWIGAPGEEHAFVSSGFLVFTHATGLLLSRRVRQLCIFVWREGEVVEDGGRTSWRLGGDARHLYCRGGGSGAGGGCDGGGWRGGRC